MTNAQPLLQISDGTTTINLLDLNGIMLYDWVPAIPEAKSGGIWKDSPLFEGRQLAYRKLGTVIDTFDLKVRGRSQDDAIRRVQELRRLLEKAISYWTDDAQNQPVYLVARAPYETNTRYAVILDYRTPRDANPFKQPFFGCTALVNQFQLAVEHGIWQDNIPGLSDCVQISGQQNFSGSVLSETATTLASADDAGIGSGAWSTSATSLELRSDYKVGVRFYDVDVPNGANIVSAHIEFVSTVTSFDFVSTIIYGEDADDANIFSTEVDFNGRTRTTAHVDWLISDPWVASMLYATPDLTAIVQEIVNRVGWASGNHMSFLFDKNAIVPPGGPDRHVASHDHTIYRHPYLYIIYTLTGETTYGRAATCNAKEVQIVNKHNRANLTHIYYYDANPVTWSANLVSAATPFAFLPAAPDINDLVYFGIQTSVGDSGPFDNLVFDITTAASIAASTWEYYNGGAWDTLTVRDNTAAPDAFEKLGVHSVHWIPPTDWAATAINGVTAFWVRMNVSGAGAGTPPSQGNRGIYTATWPCVELQADQVEGDLNALARIIAVNTSDGSGGGSPNLCANRILIGGRSVARGENFTPYLNVSDEQNPSGVTVALGTHTSFGNDIPAPTGRSATYTSDAEETTTEVTITLDNSLAPEYLGRFRAFLRYKFTTGSAGDVSLQLITTPGGAGLARYSDVYYPQVNTDWQVVDFGIVNLPLRAPIDQYGEIKFEVSVYASATGKVVKFYDLILLPVDEWHADAVDKSGLTARTGAVGYGDMLEFDSTSFPRQPDQAVLKSADDGRIQGYYQNRSSGLTLLQANAEQKLWFFCLRYESGTQLSSPPDIAHAINVYRVQRYHGFRGAR